MSVDDGDEWVTILRTSDAQRVRMLAGVLAEENIPVQHPGLEHASMVPGLHFIEIHLRVPGQHSQAALELVEAFEQSEPEGEEGMVLSPSAPYRGGGSPIAFRYTNNASGGATLLGAFISIVLFALWTDARAFPNVALLFVLPAIGHSIGKAMRTNHCSQPRCGATLHDDSQRCDNCGARIVGNIDHPREHLDSLDDYARSHGLPAREPVPEDLAEEPE